MFGIGFGELLVLVAIGIVILGPERCVSVAKTLGAMVRKFRKEWREVKEDLKDITQEDDKPEKDR